MRILLVDDDPSIRAVIRRVLQRQLTLNIVECGNGLEALELLSQQRYGLVILDHLMPVLNGIDTLRAIRQSATLARTPVFMMTAIGDADMVERAAGFGVAEYILKPLRPGDLVERVTRLIRAHELSDTDSMPGAPTVFQPLELSPESAVLIADGSPEFRHFFRRAVTSLCQVREADSGIAAFRAALDDPAKALFIGSDLGVFTGDLLAQHIRRNPRTDAVRVIAVMPPHQLRRVKKQSPYEAVILRTFVADLFKDGFMNLMRRPGRMSHLLGIVPDLKLLGIAAFEEALGALFHAAAIPRAPEARDTSKFAAAMLTIRFQEEGLPLLVELAANRRHAKKLADLLENPGADSSAEVALMGLLNRMAKSLSQEFQNQGLAVQVSAAAPRSRGPGERASQADDAVTIDFDVAGKGARVRLDLRLADDVGQDSPAVS